MPNVFQCQIELRVPKANFAQACEYYARLFRPFGSVSILVPGELAVLVYAEAGAGSRAVKYAVVVRGMADSSYQRGPVVHWGWVRRDAGGQPQTIEQELRRSSGNTIRIDEATSSNVNGTLLERISGGDAFQNRVGSINPDFPGKSHAALGRTGTWGTVLALLGLGVAGALAWRGAGNR